MAQSLNTHVDLTIRANSYLGLGTHGDVLVGDRAFEYYNEKNPEDFIQIPWDQVDHVAASILFGGRWISRFAVFCKDGQGTYSFSTRDDKATLRAMRAHLGAQRLVRSASFFQVVAAGFSGLVRSLTRR